jgi:PAS domain S-box-containing protein
VPDEIIGTNVLKIHPPDRRNEAMHILMDMLSGNARICPVPLYTKDKKLIPVETTVIRGVWDDKPALFGISKDISRLQFSEEKFAKSFYFNPTPCCFSDLVTGQFQEVNDAVCGLLGYSREELVGKTVVELGIMTVEEKERVARYADEEGKLENIKAQLRTKDGKLLTVLKSAENMLVADKRYRFTVLNDVTSMLKAQELNEQYSRLQALMIKISSTYINIELDKVNQIVQESLKEMAEFVNADRAYIFDYDFDKNMCSNTFEWCREGISSEIDNLQNIPLDFIPNWIAQHQNGDAFYMPDINLLPNNGPYSVRGLLEPQGVKSLITLPMKLNDDLVGFVGFDSVRDFHAYSEKERDLLVVFSQMLVNIAERKRQAEALISAKIEAEEASKTKEIFLATMSHEIRTPLNVITGMVREMMKQRISPAQRGLLSNAKSASVHLLSILNNILDLSKIEAGEFILDNNVFDFATLLKDAEGIMTLRAQEKKIDLEMTIEPGMDTVFFGDEARIRQVLINLIDNAIKFTEQGSVRVKVGSVEVKDSLCTVNVEIKDTGVGISPDFIGKIFSKFSQEENDTKRKYQGTGLGMNIVKHLVELMGGRVEVQSTKGEGTIIQFQLILKQARHELLPAYSHHSTKAPDLTGRHILVVEDNEMNRYVVHLSLQALNCTISEAEDGKQALDLLKTQKFDLIFMDIQMPVLDGIEATRIIRDELRLDTPIIALTANAFRHNVAKYMEAGMNDFIVKPYLERDFFQKINQHLSGLPSLTVTVPEIPLYDIERLREICKNDDRFMHNMMRIFIKLVDDSVPQLEQMRFLRNYTGIQKLSHKLRPSIDNLSIVSIYDTIRVLEKVDPELMQPEQIVAMMDEVITVVKEVSDQLKSYLEKASAGVNDINK